MKMIRKVKNYFETHFVAAFTLLLAVAILLMMFVFQGYLKREYLRYLVEKSYETEDAVMESVQKNVQYSMKELVNNGSEMATNPNLLAQVRSADSTLEENKEINKNYLYLYNVLKEYDYLSNITAVAVAGSEGLICQYDRYRAFQSSLWSGENQTVVEEMSSYLLKRIENGELPRYTEFLYPREYENNSDRKIFHIAYPLTGGVIAIRNVKYILVVSYSMDTFDEFLDTIEVPKMKYLQGYVADKNGRIVYHNDANYIGKRASTLLEGEYTGLISKELGYFGWTMNVVMDEQEMKEHVDLIYDRGVTFYIILMALYIVGIAGVFQKLLKPVHLISESLRTVELGDYHSRIRIEGKNEIWQLAEEYNRMINAIESKNQEIQQQHSEKLLSIERQHQAEREALESQINAHFICNTLGCINYEAIEAGNHQVSILIKKLSNILRYTFDQKCQDVYMGQEIAWLDQYLYLQKARFETMFDYRITFSDVYNYWPCCKLMFQPFVENSILHGFEGQESGGMIRIYSEADGERVKIVIEDNGCGMDPEKATVIQEILHNKGNTSLENRRKIGIGIQNVVTRMYMYYGQKLDIEMKTVLGEGTSFIFRIPIPVRKEKRNEEV